MAQDIKILGPDGQPIRKDVLTTEVARASLTGVRSVRNYSSVANGLTPERLAAILRGALDGDHIDYLTLAEEMEDRDMHYASVLGTRKLAISGIEPIVEAASDDTFHVKHAESLRELVRAPEFGEMLDDLMDALGKGYSAVEIMWNRGQQWVPQQYIWRDPRFFMFDRETGTELRLLDEADTFNGVPLPPYKFIIHSPRFKTGLPIRRGFARLVSIGYMCKSFSIADWMAFAEVFGMPIRVGKYGSGASKDDIATLISAVANIGTDAAAVMPEGMKIEFQESVKATGGENLFERLANFFDKQTSKAVLGQTATTEGTPGKLGNEDAQSEVRRDILKADARQIGYTLTRMLAKPYIDLNFGPQDKYPRILVPVYEPEDLDALSGAIKSFVPMGLKVEKSFIHEKWGIPQSEDEDADVLTAPAAPVPDDTETAPNRQRASNREQGQDEIDELADAGADDWQEQLEPMVEPIQKLIDSCNSYEEFVEKLPSILDQLDEGAIAMHLAKAAFKARALGDATDEVDA